MIEESVDEGAVARSIGGFGISDIALRDRTIHDVRVGGWKVLKDGLVNAKVLGEDTLGSVREPVIDVEGGATKIVSWVIPWELTISEPTRPRQSFHRRTREDTRSHL
jgi:hypothetical protein